MPTRNPTCSCATWRRARRPWSLANVGGTGSGNTWTTDHGAFSPDGRSLAFTSTASDPVATDTNGASDVFLRPVAGDHERGVGQPGGHRHRPGVRVLPECAERPGVRFDGRHVAFVSYASDFGLTDTDLNTDIYLRDLLGTTTMVSTNAAYWTAPVNGRTPRRFSYDSTRVLFESGETPVRGHQRRQRRLRQGPDGRDGHAGLGQRRRHEQRQRPSSSNASISADGRTVAFQSPRPTWG